MSKRKILLVALSLCMVAILAVGGSLAYLTDTEQVTNTMVIGNISINIEEWTYDTEEGKFNKFENANDAFTLYPIDDAQGYQLWNKMVYTYNDSPSQDAAYIRTIILFEHNEEAAETDCFNGLHYFYDNETTGVNHGSKVTDLGVMTVNDDDYDVVVFTEVDNKAIGYMENLQTLASVWVDKNVTNDQMEVWGDECKIIVFSQGIQATGLEHDEAMDELGEVTAANLEKWLNGDTTTQPAPTAKINDFTK